MNKRIVFILFHATLLLLISFLIYKPIQHRLSLTPTGTVYTYEHRIHEDYFFYLMVIRQGRDGFLEYDQYTTEPTNPTAMHLYYLTLGRIGRITGLSDITMYYTGMFLGYALVYVFSWKLVCHLFPVPYRYPAMALIFLASPFPAMNIQVNGTDIPVGTSWWTNMDIYSRVTQVPHHFVGQGLMLAAVYFALLFAEKRKLSIALAMSAAAGIGILFYSVPIIVYLLSAMIVVFVFSAKPVLQSLRKHSLVKLFKAHEKLLIGIILTVSVSAVSLLFVRSILTTTGWPWNTFLTWEAAWYNHKTEIFPYTTFVYLISFGLLPVFLLPGILRILKKRSYSWIFVLSIFLTPIALYLAATYHLISLPKIRFVHSAPYVAAGLIATLGIRTVLESIKKKPIRFYTGIVILLLFVWNSLSGIRSYWLPELQKYETPYNTYIPRQYFTLIDYLNRNSQPFSNVFTSYAIGTYLPAFTKNNVYVGHMVSTANFWTKYSESNSFYAHEMSEDYAREMFRRNNILYILGEEKGLGNTYKNILTPVYSIDDLTLYKPVY